MSDAEGVPDAVRRLAGNPIERVAVTVEVVYENGNRFRQFYPNVKNFKASADASGHRKWEGDLRPMPEEKP